MKRPALLMALCATALVPSLPARAQTPPQASSALPPVIIRAKDHPMHATVFTARLNKNAYWRHEAQRQGYDVAFNEWMKQDHPYEYARYCTVEARKLTAAYKNTEHMDQFSALLPKRADLRGEVQSLGFDVAFADWLRRERPAVYREHYAREAAVRAGQRASAPPNHGTTTTGGRASH